MKDKVLKRNSHTKLYGRSLRKAPKGFLRCSAIGALVAVASLLILAFLMSYVLYMTDDPGRYVAPTAYCVLYISSFIGGYFAVKLNRVSALLCGITIGAVLAVLTFLLSLTLNHTLSSDYGIVGSLTLRMAIIVCAVIGAYIGTIKKENNKKRDYKYKKR